MLWGRAVLCSLFFYLSLEEGNHQKMRGQQQQQLQINARSTTNLCRNSFPILLQLHFHILIHHFMLFIIILSSMVSSTTDSLLMLIPSIPFNPIRLLVEHGSSTLLGENVYIPRQKVNQPNILLLLSSPLLSSRFSSSSFPWSARAPPTAAEQRSVFFSINTVGGWWWPICLAVYNI